MSVFNNSSILGNLGNSLLGGLVGQVQSNLTKDADEESWYNRTGWFGSLAKGQEKENTYMAANKERLPMIIEYQTGPPANGISSKTASNRKAIVMYINPSRMQFSNQKVIGKQITRGGIFYHHWGDDHTTLSISGNLGLSGMAGVKKLDEIYRMSGVLLAYGENTQGPVYHDGSTDLINALANGDWGSIITGLISGKTSFSDITNALKKQTLGAAMDAITGRTNNGLQSSSVAQSIGAVVTGAIGKCMGGGNNEVLGQAIFGNDSKIGEMAAGALSGLVGNLGEKLGNKLLGTKGTGALDYKENNVVNYENTYSGFSDIMDELDDPWRPRLIWIYFEDHVYIGHFASFNYVRDAASVNITYDMQFIIQREVILTSFNSTQPGFVPAIGGVDQGTF